MIEDMETLQEGRLVENKFRFGTMRDDATIAEMTRPVTGRQWKNQCYAFLIALGQGECKVEHLEDAITKNDIRPSDASVLILDEDKGATPLYPRKNGAGWGGTRSGRSGKPEIGRFRQNNNLGDNTGRRT